MASLYRVQYLLTVRINPLTPTHRCHMGKAIKHHVPDRVKPSFVNCNAGTLTLKAERHSAWMSKITNDGLTRSGT